MSKIVSADNQGIDLLSVASNSCALLEGLGWGGGGREGDSRCSNI